MKATPFSCMVNLALVLGLPAAGLAPRAVAAPAEARFDSPGPAIDRILAAIQEDAAVPVVPARLVKPVVVAASGLDMQSIGFFGIEVRDILKIWQELFPGQTPPSEEELRARCGPSARG